LIIEAPPPCPPPSTSNYLSLHVLSGDGPQVAAQEFRRNGGPGAYRPDPAKRHRLEAGLPRLPFYRDARRGENHLGAHSRQGAELPAGSHGDPVRNLAR